VQISNTNIAEGVEVITFTGEIDMHVSPQVRKALLALFSKNAKGIVVDLSGVPFMDSSGIATLVEGLRWSKNEGARFILVGLQETVSHTLKLAKLDNFFEMFPNQEEALASIG
jgi:anti-sigma B factor antagonist